jgi:hypothetical protein
MNKLLGQNYKWVKLIVDTLFRKEAVVLQRFLMVFHFAQAINSAFFLQKIIDNKELNLQQ